MKHPSLPAVAVILLSVWTCGGAAHAQTRLTSPAWKQFAEAARRYDSLQNVFRSMQKADPDLIRNPMRMQAMMQPHLAEIQNIYQAVPSKAAAAMEGFGAVDTYNIDDLRLIKLAAVSSNAMDKAVDASLRLIQLLKDKDSVREVSRELAQLYALRGEPEKAAAYATEDAMSTATQAEAAQLYTTLAKSLADNANIDLARKYALLAVRSMRTFQKAMSGDRPATMDSLQASETRTQIDYYFNSRYADLLATLVFAYQQRNDAAAKQAYIDEVRALIDDQNVWKVAEEDMNLMLKKMTDDNAAYGKAATELPEHDWIGSAPLSIAGLKGKVILIDFFATWCKPCIMAFPHLQGWKDKYAGKGLVIIGLTNFQGRYDGKQIAAPDELAKMRDDFIPRHKITWPVGIEKNGRTTFGDYKVSSIPHVVLIDRKGNVRYVNVGAGDYDKTENTIRKLLAE